ncbi:hypothetical protein D0809_24075 [Flavobacterium circumlabens]|uniref:DUF695 domain-containing protein n=2 Tax=Flavobacterium circumlabens TaxID=2133765 RepID=A0A4Y7U5K7_9FLAO|nr:hypothetical protein EV142_1182 [Flavobacterium circumlabens]TEB41723.1 hypothetical protein D0809_24075 [Flavobacterium circumlabens]
MGMVNDQKEINEFWNWFIINKNELVPKKITESFISQLDSKILSMGKFSWEIREGLIKNYMLIISPGGDVELLPATQKIIEFSPKIEDWEFYHYKPAKKWNFQLTLYEEDNVRKILDVKDWEYVLYKFSDGTFDIIFKAINLNESSEDEKLLVGDIVLESFLGEELSLKFIKNIEFVKDFDGADEQKKGSITFLKNHFDELL